MNSKKAITLLVLATLVMAMVPIMPVQAISTPANTQDTALAVDNTGDYGDTQAVTGTGVTPGYDVEVYWDSVTAWNGESGLLNTSAGKASGAFEVWFDVPEATVGEHYVWVRDTNSGENARVTAPYVVVPRVKLSSSSGLEDDKVDVKLYGYQDEADVAIVLKKAAIAAAPAAEAVGTLAAVVTLQEFTLVETPITADSVTITETIGGATWTDNALGVLTHSVDGTAVGTVDYITGEVDLTYVGGAPGVTAITGAYTPEPWATSVAGGAVGTLTAVATAQEFTSLANGLIVPGTFILTDPDANVWTDDGLGVLATGIVAAGTIDYLTGDVEVTYAAPPTAGALTAAYDHYDDKQDVIFVLSSGVETNDLGSVTKEVTIPEEADEMGYGAYTIETYDGAGNTVSEDFQIGAVISLDVDEGPVGTRVEITGSGFDDAETIVEAEVTIATDALGAGAVALPIYDFDTSEAIDNGGFTFEVVIPSVDMDDYDTIIITEAGAGDTASASFEITGEAEIEVTPGHGTQGSTVLVEGWNFTGGEDVVLSLAGAGEETYEVDSDGTFEVSYTIPAVATGTATLLADQDDYDIDADTEFRAGIMIVILNPTSGPSGTLVSVTGTGFTAAGAGGEWNATFGDEEWQSDKNTVLTEIASDLYVPTTDPGVYTVTVLDIDADIIVEVEFEVTESTYVEADPSEAPAGFDITLEGYNFAEDYVKADIEILMYNDTHEWGAGDLGWATPVDDDWDDGYFENDITLPDEDDISVGEYTIEITSGEDMEAMIVFNIVDKTVDINPRKAEFSVGDTLAFDVESSFPMDDSYIEISEPNGNLYWSTDVFDDDAGMWLSVGNIERVLYADQVSGGNPLVFLDDAPLGSWTWEMYDEDDDVVDDGAFTVVAAAADVIGEQVADLANDIADLADDLVDYTEDFADVQSSIADVSALAADAVEAANAAAEAVNAVAATANTASEAAADAADAADAAREAASGLTTLVYGAIGAALVAALAAIVSLMQISRRIAG